MLALFKTGERTNNLSCANSYIFQRQVFAYQQAIRHLGNLVIELGCGGGYGLETLAPHCNWFAGVDKHSPNLSSMNANSAFFRGRLPDLRNIGDKSFDTIVCFQVIEHIKNDTMMMNEIYRILKPSGKLLLTTPNKLRSLTRNPYHVREYTGSTIQQLVQRYFNRFTIQGVYGNSQVMQYYAANKQRIENFSTWDLFDLQHKLPATLLKIPYSIANNINRLVLYQQNAEICNTINWSDYSLGALEPECLDFFVIAEKEQ